MIINPITGLNGLGSLVGDAGPANGAASAGTGVAGGMSPSSFASFVGDATTSAIDGLRGAEQLSFDALQGKGDVRTVVDAIMTAEQSLQAAISIRDKIVSSYLEISRMAI